MTSARKVRRDAGARAPRRAAGSLEAAVLDVLWEAGEPFNAAQVRERLIAHGEAGADEPAYTTVVTILTRLYEKKALARARDGRAYRYAPVADEAGLAARRLSAMLDAARDRRAVLSRFVRDLSDNDEQLLRAVLDTRETPAIECGQG
jgi:predicted transcriptional regulator